MVDRRDLDPLGLFDGLELPPGFTTRAVGPFGVPVPVPESDGGSVAVDEHGGVVDGSHQSQDAVIAAAEAGEAYLDQVERAIDTEDCEFCQGVLRGLRQRPMDEQVQGVQELAELKRQMHGDIDHEELERIMGEFEVLDNPEEFL